MMTARAYLDWNATAPLRACAREAMANAWEVFGNPSSIHAEGRAARAVVETARERVAEIFHVSPAAVTFTSGGTEAANWLLQARPGTRLFIGATEHACVLRGHGFAAEDAEVIPVCEDGTLDLPVLAARIVPGATVAVQAANNETGVYQPLDAVAEIVRGAGGTVVCDAVQAIGRVPLRRLDAADALFFSAHKFGGPKGAGAAIVRREFDVPALLRGGGQERRRRSGTENVAAIAGLAAALAAAAAEEESVRERATRFRERIEAEVRRVVPEAVVFGAGAERLANTTCFALPGRKAETLLIAFDLAGIAVSSGSACSSGKVERSHVLQAMGVSDALCDGAIRVSTGWSTSAADVERFLAALENICRSEGKRRAA